MSCYKKIVLKEDSVEVINEVLKKGDEVISIIPFDCLNVEIYFKRNPISDNGMTEEQLQVLNEWLSKFSV